MQLHLLKKKSTLNLSLHWVVRWAFLKLKGTERVQFLCGNDRLELAGWTRQLDALRQAYAFHGNAEGRASLPLKIGSRRVWVAIVTQEAKFWKFNIF